VLRGGGRDSRGNPKPETVLHSGRVLIGWRSTAEPVDRSEVTSDQAVLYDMGRDFEWHGDDRVKIPNDYPGPRGTWQVDGQPKPWPLGWEVPLRRAP
jgi:hypothetical protein